MTAAGAKGVANRAQESSTYELFMGLMTILSLIVMAMILLVRVPQVDAILLATDTLFCVLFLFDFARSLAQAPSKRAYLFGPRPGRSVPQGVIDLLGSIPSVGIFRAFRVFRLARVARLLRARGAKSLATDFFARRAESAVYIIATLALLVLVIGSCAIAFVEPGVEASNIKTGSDAFWWAFVTITTVGYGDRFPVTDGGRFIGMITMAVGIGIFGVLTSFLSTIFMAPPSTPEAEEDEPEVAGTTVAAPVDPVAAELAALRLELAEVRRMLEAGSGHAPA